MGSLAAKKPVGGNSSKPVGEQEEQVGRVDSRARVGAPGLEPDQLGQILVLPLFELCDLSFTICKMGILTVPVSGE